MKPAGTAQMYPKDGVKASGRISNSLGFIVCTKKIPYLSFGTKEYAFLGLRLPVRARRAGRKLARGMTDMTVFCVCFVRHH